MDAGDRHIKFSYLDVPFEAALGIFISKSGKPFGTVSFSRTHPRDPNESILLSRLYFNDVGNAVWNVDQQAPDMNIEKAETAHHLLVEWLNQFLDLTISACDRAKD